MIPRFTGGILDKQNIIAIKNRMDDQSYLGNVFEAPTFGSVFKLIFSSSCFSPIEMTY